MKMTLTDNGEAASADDADVAAWVRPILLGAAKKKLSAKKDKR